MRLSLFLILTLLSLEAASQWKVKGTVLGKNGRTFKSVEILENNTNNKIYTNKWGEFELLTTRDSARVSFYSYDLGVVPSILVTSDTTVTIRLDYNDIYDSRWSSFGSSYDIINQVFGVQFSNGVDEEPSIHFEDFQDNLLIKAHAQSDFDQNHSFGIEMGLSYLPYVGRTTVQYNYINFKENQFRLHDLNLTSRLKYIKSTGLVFRMGYQSYNNEGKFGLGFGLLRDIGRIHLGANSRYYFDYFHHEAYAQFRLTKTPILTLRMVYNRIDYHDFLTIGLNYAFKRRQGRRPRKTF